MDKILETIYFDIKSPGSFGGSENLFTEAKKKIPQLTRNYVKQWLSKQNTYTLHKESRRYWTRNKVIAFFIDEWWQADILDYKNISRYNKSFKYILTVTDVFSKYTFLIPLKSKNANEVCLAFRKLFDNRKPVNIHTDQGKEFNNSYFRDLCKHFNVNNVLATNHVIKSPNVERRQRDIRRIIQNYFHKRGTYVYYDVLSQIEYKLNHTVNRLTKMQPAQVTIDDEPVVFETLYGAKNMIELMQKNKPNQQSSKSALNSGDTVRMKFDKKVFDKSSWQNWSDTIYKVDKLMKRETKPQYKIILDGEKLFKSFYPEELQKVHVDSNTEYPIERIVRRRKQGNRIEYLVKYRGYPMKYNQWKTRNQLIYYRIRKN